MNAGDPPTPDALDVSGLDLPRKDVQEILRADRDAWLSEIRTSSNITPRSVPACQMNCGKN